jgi:hypothetical protein
MADVPTTPSHSPAAALAPDEHAAFSSRVLRPLARLRRALRAAILTHGLATALLVFLAAALAQALLDRTFDLPRDMRAAILVAIAGVVAITVVRRIIRPLAAPLPNGDLAALVERRIPGSRNRLVSAVELAGALPTPSTSPALVRALVQRVIRDADTLDWHGLVHTRRLASRIALIAACILGPLLAATIAPASAAIWFRRNVLLQNIDWPQQTRLVVRNLQDGRIISPRGDDLTITADVPPENVVPPFVHIEYEPLEEPGPSGRTQMLRIGDRRFDHTFHKLAAPIRFRLTGGDERTDWLRVDVVDRPAVADVVIRVQPPAYTQTPAYALRPGLTVAEILAGSDIEFRITTNKPVIHAQLVRGTTPLPGAVQRQSDTAWTGRDRPLHDAEYHFALTDALGLTNEGDTAAPIRFTVRLRADQPPQVRLDVRGVSDMITPEAVLPAQIEFTDQYGLAAAQIVMESTRLPNEPRIRNLDGLESGSKVFATALEWPLAPLGVLPTDRLSLYARAEDFDNVNGPNVGKSAVLSLRVVTRQELLDELVRREQRERQTFERIVRDQEDLYSELLALFASIGDGAPTPEQTRDLARFERRQRRHTTRTDAVRRRLDAIVDELRVNRALTPALRTRLADRIITPMTAHVRDRMPQAARDLALLAAGGPTPPSRQAVQQQQAALLDAMRSILNQMIEYEGFHEAVSLLRDILEMQRSVNEATEQRAAEDIERLFQSP